MPLLLERSHQGDVLIEDGRIVAVGAQAVSDTADRLDLSGYVLLPSAVEPHAHLDKALLARRAPNPGGDLPGAITAIRAAYATMDDADLDRRATEALTIAATNGYTAVRTHADCERGIGIRAIRVLAALRERAAGLVDLQVVALAGFPVAGAAGRHHRRILGEAIKEGADVIGGAPALDPNPRAAVRELVQAAADAGLPLDLHVDETTDAGVLTLRQLAEEVGRAGLGGHATASHCVSLGQQDPAVSREVARALADAGVAVVTLPQTNLYLQGRDTPTRVPRGLTAVSALREAGVTVAGGGDNWRDPFNPLGRIDPFETAALLVAAAHLPVAEAYQAVSDAGRAVLGLPAVSLTPGSPADLVAIRAASLDEAVAGGCQDRIVLRGGVIARTRVVPEITPGLSAQPAEQLRA